MHLVSNLKQVLEIDSGSTLKYVKSQNANPISHSVHIAPVTHVQYFLIRVVLNIAPGIISYLFKDTLDFIKPHLPCKT